MRFVEFNLILNDKTTCVIFEGKGRGYTFLLNGNGKNKCVYLRFHVKYLFNFLLLSSSAQQHWFLFPQPDCVTPPLSRHLPHLMIEMIGVGLPLSVQFIVKLNIVTHSCHAALLLITAREKYDDPGLRGTQRNSHIKHQDFVCVITLFSPLSPPPPLWASLKTLLNQQLFSLGRNSWISSKFFGKCADCILVKYLIFCHSHNINLFHFSIFNWIINLSGYNFLQKICIQET